MKVSTLFSILKLSKMAWEKAGLLSKTPLLLIHGKDDNICKPENAVKFFERVETSDKEMILLDGIYNLLIKKSLFFNSFFIFWLDVRHDVIKDKKHRDIANDVIKFMDKNLL